MKKAIHPEDVIHFQKIPNIGEAMEADFKLIGIKTPQLKLKV